MTVPASRAKVDGVVASSLASKIRLLSVKKPAIVSAASVPSRCASADAAAAKGRAGGTAAGITSASVAALPSSHSLAATTTTTATASNAPLSRTGSSAFAREASKASSSLSKRSVSSEDARRMMKEKMQRPPDIAPVRGGNINIDNVTPEYVQEFWTRKKLEADEFRRKRQGAAGAVGAAPGGGSPSGAPSAAPAAAGAAPTAKPTRQPLRVARPAGTASKLAPPSRTAAQRPAAATTVASPPARPRSTSPVQPSGPEDVKRGRVPLRATSSKETPLVGSKPRTMHSASPAVQQPVARKLLVGSAATPSQGRSSSASGPLKSTNVPPAAHASGLKKKTSGLSNGVGSSGKDIATNSAAVVKRVHIDPTVVISEGSSPSTKINNITTESGVTVSPSKRDVAVSTDTLDLASKEEESSSVAAVNADVVATAAAAPAHASDTSPAAPAISACEGGADI